jgi:glycosyltransferase involved in cell wall biosynthesis
VVHNGVNGLLVEPGSTQELYKAVYRLLSDEELARHYGHAGQELVAQNFSVKTMVEQYLRLYQGLVHGTKQAAV